MRPKYSSNSHNVPLAGFAGRLDHRPTAPTDSFENAVIFVLTDN